MRISQTDTHFTLEELAEPEWFFLQRLPALAAGEGIDPINLSRLFPDPLDVAAAHRKEQEGFLEDWKEYVQPDLSQAFQEARDVVKDDLEFVSETAELHDNGEERIEYSLKVTRESVEAWFSTLNQARLLMNEAYDIAAAEDRMLLAEGELPEDPLRRLLLVQYGLYTFLQSFLIENLMEA